MTVETNADGLKVAYGLSEAARSVVGTLDYGVYKELIVELDHSLLPAHTASDTLVATLDEASIPAGAILRDAEIIVTEAFDSGGSATLTLGLAQSDGTEIDFDGIDAAIAETAIDTIGEIVSCDGALVATTGGGALAYKGFVTVNVGTATFTTGRAIVRIRYAMAPSF
jgi:hypothetical protein